MNNVLNNLNVLENTNTTSPYDISNSQNITSEVGEKKTK